MIKPNEIGTIFIASLIFMFVICFGKLFKGGLTLEFTLVALAISLAVILINIFGKKLAARYFDASIEHKIFSWQRYGFYERSKFPVAIPAGIVVPFLLAVLSQGYFLVLTFLQYEITPLVSRVRKSVGLYRFSEMTEADIKWISVFGIIATLFFAIVAYFIGGTYFILFAKLSIYYAFWNMLPLGNIDGTKIFFGGIITWIILEAITILALGYAIMLV